MTPSIFVSTDQALVQRGTLIYPCKPVISFCHNQLDLLFQDTAEDFLEDWKFGVPSALCFPDSEAMYLVFNVFLCLLEQAVIQVLTDNTTAVFC